MCELSDDRLAQPLAQSQFVFFGLVNNSNVEHTVDCRARHWMLS